MLTGVPFLPVPLLLMLSPTRGLWDFVWSLQGKGDGALAAIRAYSDVLAYVLAGIFVAGAALALRYRALAFHGFGWVLFPIGVLTYLALPQVIFETYLADQRMPISLAFMLIACLDVDFRSRFARWGFATALVLIVTARVAEVEYVWAPLSAGVESFRQSVELLNRGAKVAVAYADPNGGDSLLDYGLVHADCIAVIERSALVTTEFTVVGKQILHARPAWRTRVDTEDGTPPTIGEMVRIADVQGSTLPRAYGEYWRRWTADYDYLYVLFTKRQLSESRSGASDRNVCRRPIHSLSHRTFADHRRVQTGPIGTRLKLTRRRASRPTPLWQCPAASRRRRQEPARPHCRSPRRFRVVASRLAR